MEIPVEILSPGEGRPRRNVLSLEDNSGIHVEDVAASDAEAKNHRGRKRRSDLKLSKVRVGVETALALFVGHLGILTMFRHDWIEALTGWDLDHHNGSVEWLIVVAMLAVPVAIGIVARRHWRLLTAATE
jgi:hypothetical protein